MEMARVNWILPFTVMLAAILAVSASSSIAKDMPQDLPDPEALSAFKHYGEAFEEYESKILKQGEERFNKAWNEVRRAYHKEKAKLNAEQLHQLEDAAAKYRKHLESHTDAENKPYVMLNLAQILNLIGDHLLLDDSSAGAFSKSEALALLKDLEIDYKTFTHREQALYLRAVILETLDRRDEAFIAWQSLAATARTTIYGVYARVAVGDYHFAKDNTADAMAAYEKALELLPAISDANTEYESLRINYRLSWSAYRAAELETAIKASIEILRPGRNMPSEDDASKMTQDAVELIGDALYENNILRRSKDILKRKEIRVYAAAIGQRTLQRYNANAIHSEAVSLGDFLIDEFPLSKEAPLILQLTADSYDKLGRSPKRFAALEKLALLLPLQSLWRSRHQSDLSAIHDMEKKAANAATLVAASSYETGLSSGNNKAFQAAAASYEVLLEHAPNSDQSNEWRLRRAHCFYFIGNYDEATRLYEELKTAYKVDPETLQVASYQLVLTNERRWREAFGQATQKSQDPYKDPDVIKSLEALEKSSEEFAARFPSQTRSVDLLLVAASANRDMNRFSQASKFWQRALVSQPSPAQRGVAIRGMIFTSMKTGSTGDVVDLTKKFLKLEDWKTLGLNLGNELGGVLSVAALDEGKRLSDGGQVLEAGQLLSQIATEFPDVPDRDRIYRDGAYLLAIGGDWAGAQKSAESYEKAGLTQSLDDMTYLKARAHEYQLRLHDAAKVYFDLGERFPNHSRAASSLERAEKLAVAEEDFELAANAAALQAQRSRDSAARLAAFTRAVDHLDRAEDPRKALLIARQRLNFSGNEAERLRSRVLVARMTYKTGDEQQAIDELTILSRQLPRVRNTVPQAEFASISGEIHTLLGDEAKRKFDDFLIHERSGNLASNIEVKSRYFEDLTASYDKAADSGDAKWAARARFQLAAAAEAFADEIASVPNKTEENLTLRARTRYNATVERLQSMARRYYSANVLAARTDPSRMRNDEWVKKSVLRLDGERSLQPENAHRDVLPPAAQDSLPSQWSL